MESPLYTLGHGTLDAVAFATRLRAAGVTCAADVRRFAGSRRNPQFGADALRASLRSAGISYVEMSALGGRREPLPDSRNVALRNAGFRGYADYMQTPEFAAGLEALLAQAAREPTAIFCAETLWWRCHRRIVADAVVLLHGRRVRHLVGASAATHTPTLGVRVTDGTLLYDGGV
ncbi:MAG: DUF488 family protein [Candidatus Velthaea sp.]